MRRILVIGPGGAGKTVFSKSLGQVLNLPVVHLDSLYWHPGWRPTPPEEWDRLVDGITHGPSWILDGNYGRTLERRLAKADSIFFLDLPRLLCIWRVLRRRVAYSGGSRPSVTEGCPERVTWEFIRWIWTFRKRKRPGIHALLREVETEKVVTVLRSPTEVRAYLAGLTPPVQAEGKAEDPEDRSR